MRTEHSRDTRLIYIHHMLFMIKIQSNGSGTTIWLLPSESSLPTEKERAKKILEIEKLLLRCVIILILKIHYFAARCGPSRDENAPNSTRFPFILNDFSRESSAESTQNLISNKSRNTFLHFLWQIILMLRLSYPSRFIVTIHIHPRTFPFFSFFNT